MIPDSTRAVIAASHFRVEPETFRVASASAVRHPERHRLVHRDELETTVVTTDEGLADLDIVAVNRERWRLFTITCANPFYCVGFISAITQPMTEAGIDVLLYSTFSRDLVFVSEGDEARAQRVLLQAGFRQAPAPSR